MKNKTNELKSGYVQCWEISINRPFPSDKKNCKQKSGFEPLRSRGRGYPDLSGSTTK